MVEAAELTRAATDADCAATSVLVLVVAVVGRVAMFALMGVAAASAALAATSCGFWKKTQQ